MRLFRRTANVDAAGAADLLATRSAVLVDVRQPAEWKTGHIDGCSHDVLDLKGGISAWTRAGLPISTAKTREK